ncbi:RNA polymerase subunit sigma-70 [Amycolatopsis albispora]|uniref:RNA polymerase sigma factor n=1 Tax=Amycolatopsis albispora TaxID=1804986 RepID=A0A344LI29_9PSEU|nr:RNA polymerase subunit sigma-70 [Amycolatopsis albispora]AXB47703.1 RNA polymerase subunit sigma-70 [Amycolatopsis albispora]
MDVLDRARRGDERAFRELTEPHHHELRVHCYRMLGSLTDAEDVLQETLLAAWRGLDGYACRASVRTWLYRIATNRCLNAMRDASRRRPPEPTPSFEPPEPSRRTDVTWLQPCPDAVLGPETSYHRRETVELAFIAALQRLPPRQTATLLLRDVLGYSTAEAAELLGTSPTAVKGALQRARAQLDRPADPDHTPLPDSPAERELTRRFADAFTAGDVDGILALLTDDAWLSMPPAPHEYQGDGIAALFTTFATWCGPRIRRLVPTRANTQPAFGCYLDGKPAGLFVLTPTGDGISALTWFLHDGLRPRFGLPATVT